MKCFVTICANLFIGVSHINGLHNWPTGWLFNITFPQDCIHALTALFLLFLAFLDNLKEVEQSWLDESWSCPSVSSYLLSRVLFFCFLFLVIFGGREGRARLCSFTLLTLYQLLLSYWLRVSVKIHCDQSHEAKLTFIENVFCVNSQKQCKGVCVCVYVCACVCGNSLEMGDTEPLFINIMETSNLENVYFLIPL